MIDRRTFLGTVAGAGAALAVSDRSRADDQRTCDPPAAGRRRIPASGELVPMIGLGTSRTFNVDPETGVDPLVDVMRSFLATGGTVIDSSPMYGRAEGVVGVLLERLGRDDVFFATKVWTDEGREAGETQMRESMRLMHAPLIDLMQVHNLVAWQTHLPVLREWKQAGRIRYIGVTEMHDFDVVERLMLDEDLDFIQIPYSVADRQVEDRVLPAALDTGTAVLVMRPFERGRLFGRVGGKALPAWAVELGCTSWAQVFLKFVLGHPAVTCPIPATSKVHHLLDNMTAGTGPLPDEATRRKIIEAID